MKKTLLMTFTIAVVATALPARASMMCQHDWLAAWRNSGTGDNRRIEGFALEPADRLWMAGADIGNAGFQSVIGVARCSISTGVPGTTQPNINHSSTGFHCWCRMVSPAFGMWVHSHNFTTSAACASGCASSGGGCSYQMIWGGNFIRNIILMPASTL